MIEFVRQHIEKFLYTYEIEYLSRDREVKYIAKGKIVENKFTEIGKGIKYKQTETKLTIEVDLTKDFGLSGSGKSTIIASTSGNKALDNKVVAGINIYTKVN